LKAVAIELSEIITMGCSNFWITKLFKPWAVQKMADPLKKFLQFCQGYWIFQNGFTIP